MIGQFTRYLALRTGQHLLRPMPDVTAAARLILETAAFFALHRHYDPYPTAIDDASAEATVVDALVNAYAIASEEKTPHGNLSHLRDTTANRPHHAE